MSTASGIFELAYNTIFLKKSVGIKHIALVWFFAVCMKKVALKLLKADTCKSHATQIV